MTEKKTVTVEIVPHPFTIEVEIDHDTDIYDAAEHISRDVQSHITDEGVDYDYHPSI